MICLSRNLEDMPGGRGYLRAVSHCWSERQYPLLQDGRECLADRSDGRIARWLAALDVYF